MKTKKTKYQKHKTKWESCTRCKLHKTRDKVVLCRGTLPCDVLFVGEAPGRSENRLGKPFIGPAGKLLDGIIRDTGKFNAGHRKAFTNLIACIPLYPGTNFKVKEPEEKCLAKCEPRLKWFIEKIAKPQLIVCVGKLAGSRLPELDMESKKGCTFAHIVHPAAILRADRGRQGLMIQRCVVTLEEAFEELLPF